jgi:hypothetical protein
MAHPIRRNVAHLSQAERQAYAEALRDVDLQTFADGVSYWDKQDQIHEGTHNHNGNSFVPWHRELVNRFEKLVQQVNPDMALHYWDWTQDPRAADDGQGGVVNLCTDDTFGTANGMVSGTLAPLHNGGDANGARPSFGGPFTQPPQAITRDCNPGAPPVATDDDIITSSDGLAQAQQWTAFRTSVESSHDSAHTFFGNGNIFDPHTAFEDPFVFLLHSDVDRLFAMWQTLPGQDWRLDPDQVYGDQSNTNDSRGILHNLQPWDGTVEFGAPIEPWTGNSSAIEVKNSRHPSVVRPPCYDTLPLTVEQVAPVPGDPIRFLDVPEGEQTARALRLRVRGCHQVTAQATLAGDPAFSLLAASVQSPEPDGFETHDLLVWVLYTAGAPQSVASGNLDVTVPATATLPEQVYSVPIEANAVTKPTVAASLVLDRSGSMDNPSGVPMQKRIDILKSAAPLFVTLLDDEDGIGVVRFDTDAVTAPPADTIDVAGSQIAGAGRTDALQAISTHATNPNGLTAIGDGVEAAASQLAAASGFDLSATVVFTDGHETAEKYIHDVSDLINSRVFAIGLGTAEQLNPGALSDLVDGTGGYLMLTGNPGSDDQILLQKYFAQVVAGVTNAVTVVDPDGFVPLGDEAVVPYHLTAAESRSDVIVLSPAAAALVVTLEAPDGSTFSGTIGADQVTTEQYQTLRLGLRPPAFPTSPAGTWRAHLKVDDHRLQRWLNKLESRKDAQDITRIRTHGVPFTLAVQARSSLRLKVAVAQPSRVPGSQAVLTATLTESGIPLGHSAQVDALVTAPDGTPSTLGFTEIDDGVYRAAAATPTPGVYSVLVRAWGTSLRGEPFTRQELRTLAVWSRGDDRVTPPVPGAGVDWCDMLTCVWRRAIRSRRC